MYHYTDGGIRNVWLANGYEIKRTPFGEGVSFHNLEPIAKAVERIKTVERLVKQKIVVKESRGHWRPSLQDEGVTAH